MSNLTENKKINLEFIERLLLDEENPRFGTRGGESISQADILDKITDEFGVDDILSSLAMNGYFHAEPLVCKQLDGGEIVVAEGNRRLAACLILLGDPRASRQARRTSQYRKIWQANGAKPVDPVPVLLFNKEEQKKDLLPYLGVRHIISSQPWDSYAKAVWVAKVVEEHGFNVTDISKMIGDNNRTIARMLEGYYFMAQLIESGVFNPENSVRRGRGSNSEFPFSWVYTILGYTSVRNFLDLDSEDGVPQKRPVKEAYMEKAATVVCAMFGDKSKARNAAITDSRQLGDLAKALNDPIKLTLIEQGKSLEDVKQQTQPLEELLRSNLFKLKEIQTDLIARITTDDFSPESAIKFSPETLKNSKLAIELHNKTRNAAFPEVKND